MPATPRTLTFTMADVDSLNRLDERARLERMDPEGVKLPLLEGPLYPTVWGIEDLIFRPRPNWLIEGLVEERGLTIFFGPDKVGKTAVLSSFLWAWCSGHDQFLSPDFKMKDSSADTRKVLYVLLEGQAAFYSRYDAWREAYNEGGFLENFFVIDEGMSLFEKSMTLDNPDTWPASVKRLWNAVEEIKPDILVIDTWSRATPGMDENSPQTAVVVAWLDQLRDTLGTSTIVVHHVAKDKSQKRSPRGHGSLKGAASSYVCIDAEPEDMVRKLYSGPHRNAENRAAPYEFISRSTKYAFVIQEAGKVRQLNPREREMVELLNNEGPMTLIELAKQLGMDKANARRTVRNSTALELIPTNGNAPVLVRVVQADEPTDL